MSSPFGPDLQDGRHLLIVTNDNDFFQAQPSRFFAFAIDPAGFSYQPQQFTKRGESKCKVTTPTIDAEAALRGAPQPIRAAPGACRGAALADLARTRA